MKAASIIVVSGHPATGKSTLARELSNEMSLPLVARDVIKESLIQTHSGFLSDNDWNMKANAVFSDVVLSHLKRNVSLVVEAAFQNTLWQQIFLSWADLANIHVIECCASEITIIKRFERRMLANAKRVRFHNDADCLANIKQVGVRFESIVCRPEPIIVNTEQTICLADLLSELSRRMS